MRAPCKDCEDRVVGCHSECEKYLAFKKQNDEYKRLKDEYLTKEKAFYSNSIKKRRK